MNRPQLADECYVITVEGIVSGEWLDWPCQVETRYERADSASGTVTALTVTVPDQPALHGLLEKIRDLNLKLVSFQRLEQGGRL